MPDTPHDIQQDTVDLYQSTDPAKRRITQGDPTGHGLLETSQTEQQKPEVRSGAGVDIDSARMPADGVLEVHDSDDEILDEEKDTSIASNGPREGAQLR